MKNLWHILLGTLFAGIVATGGYAETEEEEEKSSEFAEAKSSWSLSFDCVGGGQNDDNLTHDLTLYDYQSLGSLLVQNLEEYRGAVEVERKSISWLRRMLANKISAPLQVHAFAALRRSDYWVDGYAVRVESPEGESWLVWDGNHDVGLTARAALRRRGEAPAPEPLYVECAR